MRARLVAQLSPEERNDFGYLWDYTARPEQLPPQGDWRIWMIMAGAGSVRPGPALNGCG